MRKTVAQKMDEYPKVAWRQTVWRKLGSPNSRICCGCGYFFGDESMVYERTTQESIFRGDDEVEIFCKVCGSSEKAKV